MYNANIQKSVPIPLIYTKLNGMDCAFCVSQTTIEIAAEQINLSRITIGYSQVIFAKKAMQNADKAIIGKSGTAIRLKITDKIETAPPKPTNIGNVAIDAPIGTHIALNNLKNK
ncbi:MAG: hypothetical protein RR573_10305 [Oscillospiraceae bacterium]